MLLQKTERYADRNAGDSPDDGYEPPLPHEDSPDHGTGGAERAQCSHVVGFLEHHHRKGGNDIERGYQQNKRQHDERYPFFDGYHAKRFLFLTETVKHPVILSKDFRQLPDSGFRIRSAPETQLYGRCFRGVVEQMSGDRDGNDHRRGVLVGFLYLIDSANSQRVAAESRCGVRRVDASLAARHVEREGCVGPRMGCEFYRGAYGEQGAFCGIGHVAVFSVDNGAADRTDLGVAGRNSFHRHCHLPRTADGEGLFVDRGDSRVNGL